MKQAFLGGIAAPAAARAARLAAALLVASVGGTARAGDAPVAPPSPTPSPAPSPLPVASPAPAVAAPARFSLAPSFDADLLRDLPLGRSLWSVLESVEATAIVDRMESGGLYAGEPGLVGVRGSSWTQAHWLLGDFDVTDPDRGGVPLLLIDPEAIERLEVSAGLMPADQFGASPAFTLAVRRPGSAWRRSLEAAVVPASLQQAPQRTDGAPAIAHFGGFDAARFSVDGPLRPTLGLLVSGNRVSSRRIERNDGRPLTGRETGLLAQLTFTPSDAHEGRLIGAVQQTVRPYPGRARFGGGDVRENGGAQHLQATWQRRTGLPWSATAGFVRASSDPRLPELPGRSATVERLRDGPLPLQFGGRNTRGRWGVSGWADPVAGPRHALRLGAALAWSHVNTRPAGPRAPTPESVAGIPARVWDYGWAGPISRWRATDAAAFLDDQLRLGRLELDLGLRLESTTGSAAGSDGRIAWTMLSPRTAARVSVTRGLTLLGGYARYRSRMPLSLLAYGDPAAAQGRVYRWLDQNGDGAFQAEERGVLVSRVGPGGPHVSIDPGLRAPRSKEVFVGFEARARSWRFRGLAYHRREKELVTSFDVGSPASAYDLRFVPDPGDDIVGAADDYLLPVYDRRPESFGADRYLLANEGEKGHAKGLEVSISGSLGPRLRVLIGGTASKAYGPSAYTGFLAIENDQGIVGERREEPNALHLSKGRLFFERGYSLNTAIAYRAPGDVRLGVVARYQDGQHFARLVIPTDLNQGPEPIKGIYNGDSRFTYVLTIDARLEKGFRVGRARMAAIFEAFNLRGTAIEVEEDVVWGPSYRATTAVQPPRAVRVGMRWDF